MLRILCVQCAFCTYLCCVQHVLCANHVFEVASAYQYMYIPSANVIQATSSSCSECTLDRLPLCPNLVTTFTQSTTTADSAASHQPISFWWFLSWLLPKQVGSSLVTRLPRNTNMYRGESLVYFLRKHDVTKIGLNRKATLCALFNQLCIQCSVCVIFNPDSQIRVVSFPLPLPSFLF